MGSIVGAGRRERARMFEREARIINHREVAPGVFLMTLCEPSVAGKAEPGQFVMVRVSGGLDPLLRRPFSICGRAGDDAFLLLYRVVGRGTALLSAKRPGETIEVLGPLGRGFSTEKAAGPALLAGGGMGVAPLFFLAQTLAGSSERPFDFVAGYASCGDVLDPGVILGVDLKVEIATDDGTAGHAGFVTDLVAARLKEEGPGAVGTVFTCGPQAMLERVAALTSARAVPCQVSLEAAMACGLGACLGCAVHAARSEPTSYYRVCREGPVFDAHTLDWTRMDPSGTDPDNSETRPA